jgi:hypothetical protein
MTTMLEHMMGDAGVTALRWRGDVLVGAVDVQSVGRLRALARAEGEGFTCQLEWLPPAVPSGVFREALVAFLSILRRQVTAVGVDFNCGLTADPQGRVWLGVAGALASAREEIEQLIALARLGLRPARALCRDESLARVYVEMQGAGPGSG